MQSACPNKLFLLTGISACISNPDTHVMVLLRPVKTINDKNGPFHVDGAKFSKADQVQFCKRYIVRSLNFTIAGTEIEDIELLISQTITKLYENEGLILIGGYQSDFD